MTNEDWGRPAPLVSLDGADGARRASLPGPAAALVPGPGLAGRPVPENVRKLVEVDEAVSIGVVLLDQLSDGLVSLTAGLELGLKLLGVW